MKKRDSKKNGYQYLVYIDDVLGLKML